MENLNSNNVITVLNRLKNVIQYKIDHEWDSNTSNIKEFALDIFKHIDEYIADIKESKT